MSTAAGRRFSIVRAGRVPGRRSACRCGVGGEGRGCAALPCRTDALTRRRRDWFHAVRKGPRGRKNRVAVRQVGDSVGRNVRSGCRRSGRRFGEERADAMRRAEGRAFVRHPGIGVDAAYELAATPGRHRVSFESADSRTGWAQRRCRTPGGGATGEGADGLPQRAGGQAWDGRAAESPREWDAGGQVCGDESETAAAPVSGWPTRLRPSTTTATYM